MKQWKKLAILAAIGVLPFRVGAEGEVKDSLHVPMLQASEVTTEQRALPTMELQKEEGTLAFGEVRTESTYTHIVYPEFMADSRMVQERVNKDIRSYVEGLEKDVLKQNLKDKEHPTELYVDYGVMENKDGILSVIIRSYTYTMGYANGTTVEKGFSFNATSGKKLYLYDLGTYKVDRVKSALDALIAKDKEEGVKSDYMVPEDLKVSKNFYLDDGSVYLIYDQGVIAPRSHGNVHLKIDEYKVRG